jgi:plastocyanin
MRNSAICVLLLGAALAGGCGGGGDDDGATIDATANTDVVEVDCAGATIAATITTMGFAYLPATQTVSVGDIVEFAPLTGHDVNDANGAFHVGFGGDACFRFDAADTYTFHCSAHDFTGTLTVE